MYVYVVCEFDFVGVCLGEEVEGQPRLVCGHSVALQATEPEVQGGFEFTESGNRVSPIDCTTRIERKGFAYQLLLGAFVARFC